MVSFNRVMVMGAGAVGGYFGGRIAQHTSAKVTLIARGEHLEALQQNGLQIKSVDGDATVKVDAFDDPAKAEKPNLILFTVKSYDTPKAISKIKPVVNENTQILTIQNGIENYMQLVEAFGTSRVIQGFCKIGAGITEPGIVEHKAFGEITAGEQDGHTSARIKKLTVLCNEANIPLHVTSKIERKVWLKFAWNCVFNMITAVGNVTVEKLFADSEVEQFCYNVFYEIKLAAKMGGIKLTEDDAKNIIEPARNLKGFTTSTYQDRQKGKRLEYEAFTGAIVRLADKHGFEAPHNRMLYALLKLIDNGN